MKKLFLRDQKGFTLIELLIVVAILAILAAIAIPQFSKYKKNATASSVAGAIASCGSELAAENAVDSSKTSRTCQLPGGVTCDLSISAAGVLSGCGSVTVSGVTVSCTWSNNSVSCSAS